MGVVVWFGRLKGEMVEGLGICALRCGCGVCICFEDRWMDGRSQVDVGAKDCNMICQYDFYYYFSRRYCI